MAGLKYLLEKEPARQATESQPSASPVYIVRWAPNGIELAPGVESCWDIFHQSATRAPDAPCLAWRPAAGAPYRHFTYGEALALATDMSAAYASLGVAPRDRVGIFGANTPEWMLAMQACNRLSATCVPVYDTLGADVVEVRCCFFG